MSIIDFAACACLQSHYPNPEFLRWCLLSLFLHGKLFTDTSRSSSVFTMTRTRVGSPRTRGSIPGRVEKSLSSRKSQLLSRVKRLDESVIGHLLLGESLRMCRALPTLPAME